MGIGPWLQALVGSSSKLPMPRSDVLAVLMANAVLIGFNIALADMLLSKAMTLSSSLPLQPVQTVSCPPVPEWYRPQGESSDESELDEDAGLLLSEGEQIEKS